MAKHKHAEIIKAWADGAAIQYRHSFEQNWKDLLSEAPSWNACEYRVKPEPKPDLVRYVNVHPDADTYFVIKNELAPTNLKLTFDGEDRFLKFAEVI